MFVKSLYLVGMIGIVDYFSYKSYNDYVEMKIRQDPQYIKTMEYPTLPHWKLAIKEDIRNRKYRLIKYTPNELIDELPNEYIKLLSLNDYSGDSLSGEKFNKLSSHIPLYKITRENEIHRDMKYEDGLNIDTNQKLFGIDRSSRNVDFAFVVPSYGIYFSDVPKKWSCIYACDKNVCYVRKVTVPDDARVIIERNEVRADKVILGKRILYNDFIKNE